MLSKEKKDFWLQFEFTAIRLLILPGPSRICLISLMLMVGEGEECTILKKTVADTSSIPATDNDRVPQRYPFTVFCCHFCGGKGVVVEHFPRRGYGRRNSKANLRLI
jgi:hypothetical protein